MTDILGEILKYIIVLGAATYAVLLGARFLLRELNKLKKDFKKEEGKNGL
jgi:hypothetical protein